MTEGDTAFWAALRWKRRVFCSSFAPGEQTCFAPMNFHKKSEKFIAQQGILEYTIYSFWGVRHSYHFEPTFTFMGFLYCAEICQASVSSGRQKAALRLPT